jgi:glycosyltransferase involved in cell wall biosynthesis
LENVEVAESAFRLEWMDEPWEDVKAAGDWLLALERDFRPDIVHLNGYAHGVLPWGSPTLVAGHSCVLSWWQAVKHEQTPELWRRYEETVSRGLKTADMVVAPSRAMLDCLREHYGELEETRVIPNGRRIELFEPAGKETFILSAGRLWDEAKNVRAVCACSLKLSWPVWLAGETTLAAANNAEDVPFNNVRLLGRLSGREMIQCMARASIYAHPAKYEPFGLSVLEAALSGCALVLGDVPSLRENWNGAAIFVDPEDPEQLREVLAGLIEKVALRRELGYAARERGLHFDIQSTAMRYIEAYETLLQRTVRPTGRGECIPA